MGGQHKRLGLLDSLPIPHVLELLSLEAILRSGPALTIDTDWEQCEVREFPELI